LNIFALALAKNFLPLQWIVLDFNNAFSLKVIINSPQLQLGVYEYYRLALAKKISKVRN